MTSPGCETRGPRGFRSGDGGFRGAKEEVGHHFASLGRSCLLSERPKKRATPSGTVPLRGTAGGSRLEAHPGLLDLFASGRDAGPIAEPAFSNDQSERRHACASGRSSRRGSYGS